MLDPPYGPMTGDRSRGRSSVATQPTDPATTMRFTRAYTDAPLAPGRKVLLDPIASAHLVRVLKLGADAPVVVFNGDGRDYHGRIAKARKDCVEVELEHVQEAVEESPDGALEVVRLLDRHPDAEARPRVHRDALTGFGDLVVVVLLAAVAVRAVGGHATVSMGHSPALMPLPRRRTESHSCAAARSTAVLAHRCGNKPCRPRPRPGRP